MIDPTHEVHEQVVTSVANSVKKKQNFFHLGAYLSVVLFLILVSFFLGKMTQSETNDLILQSEITPDTYLQENENLNTQGEHLVNNKCDSQECLFTDSQNEAVIGYGTLRGYYTTYTKTDMSDESVTCQAFVVQEGSQALIENFSKWVQEGNTLNRINENDELVVTLQLEGLPTDLRAKITSSSSTNPIELGIIRNRPVGRGAAVCESVFEIITAK